MKYRLSAPIVFQVAGDTTRGAKKSARRAKKSAKKAARRAKKTARKTARRR